MYLELLKEFREKNGLTEYKHDAFMFMVEQELKEVLGADNWDDRVGEMCDVCVLCFNALGQQGIERKSINKTYQQYKDLNEAVNDASINISNYNLYYAIDCMRDCIELNGYDFDKSIVETCKKILSRKGAINPDNGKWEKDKNQPKSELYAPDYASCKTIKFSEVW